MIWLIKLGMFVHVHHDDLLFCWEILQESSRRCSIFINWISHLHLEFIPKGYHFFVFKTGVFSGFIGYITNWSSKSSEILDEGSDSGCSSPASPWRVVAPAEVPGQIARRDLPPIQPDAPWTPPGKERLFLNHIEYIHIDIRHIHQ